MKMAKFRAHEAGSSSLGLRMTISSAGGPGLVGAGCSEGAPGHGQPGVLIPALDRGPALGGSVDDPHSGPGSSASPPNTCAGSRRCFSGPDLPALRRATRGCNSHWRLRGAEAIPSRLARQSVCWHRLDLVRFPRVPTFILSPRSGCVVRPTVGTNRIVPARSRPETGPKRGRSTVGDRCFLQGSGHSTQLATTMAR